MTLYKLVHDVTSGESQEVPLTAEELEQYEMDKQAEIDRLSEKAAQLAKKAQLLAKLGITEDDAKLLLS